jgi:Hydrazine synthase alpha subunit middle domain
MRLPVRLFAIVVSMVQPIPVCAFGTEAAKSALGADVIVTAAPEYAPLAALQGGERFPKGAQLLLIHVGKAEPLVAGFAAAADANVSFDGERVLFAGKRAAGDKWQIWEMTLKDRSVRRLIAGEGDAIRPFYLPAGRLVYARRTAHGFQLEAAGKDASYALAPIDTQAGATVLPLSYVPGSTISEDVLLDGRILFEAGFPLGTGSTPELYSVYSDGSGVESYRCDHGHARWGGKQLASGDVVFTHGNSLARFTSSLAHEAAIHAPHAEYAGAIAETADGAWLVSARTLSAAHYALMQWKPGTDSMRTVLAIRGTDLVEPVVVAPRTRPKRHPSGLHDWSYANMMALDARLSREGDLKTAPAAVRLEAMDAEGHAILTGTAPVEADGSFLVKTPADRPIRFALLDANGAVIREEHGWFWIRRGEQRYCVGCHTGPERSPENRVPAVLLRTTTPVDLTGAKTPGEAQNAAPRGN